MHLEARSIACTAQCHMPVHSLFDCFVLHLPLDLHAVLQKEGYDDSNDPIPEGPNTKLLGGKDVLYTGQGNYVRDNKERYPSKDEFGVGGFAGGEREFDKDNKQPVRSFPTAVKVAVLPFGALVSVPPSSERTSAFGHAGPGILHVPSARDHLCALTTRRATKDCTCSHVIGVCCSHC
jgi:hypothetical protein